MSESHFLHGFLNPKSVAFYGANNKGGSLAAIQIMNLIKSNYDGNVYPIHLKLDSVMGFKAYRSIKDVPEVPDLVIIVLPAEVVPDIFKECGEKGVKRIILISGGFRELIGERENTLTEEILKIAKKYGIRFIGPNCLGVFNNWYGDKEQVKAFNIAIWEVLKKGNFSIASQSGTLSSHIWFDPENIDFGLSKSLSVGNEADIDIVDCLEYYKVDKYTRVIGLYIEELKRGKKFLNLAKEITPKKPIVAIYVGGSEAGNRALQSHTGALAGDSKIYDAVFKIFSLSLQEQLKEILPTTASFKNPVDCTFDMDLPYFYIKLPEILMKSGEIDAIIQYGVVGFQDVMDDYLQNEEIAKYAEFTNQSDEVMDGLAKKLILPTIEHSKRYSIPILHISPMSYNSPWSKRLRKNGAMLFKLWDRPVNALAKICDYVEFLKKKK